MDPYLQLGGTKSCNGGLEAKPQWGSGAPGQGDFVPLKLMTFFNSETDFLTKLPDTFRISRLHGMCGSTSAPAYNGQWVRQMKPL